MENPEEISKRKYRPDYKTQEDICASSRGSHLLLGILVTLAKRTNSKACRNATFAIRCNVSRMRGKVLRVMDLPWSCPF